MKIAFHLGLVLILLLLSTLATIADESCQLQQVTVEPLINGVRIRMQADGLMRVSQYGSYWKQDEQGVWRPGKMQRISFLLRNTRIGNTTMVEINRFPASHLEFTLPQGSGVNAGLICTLVLYRPAWLTVFQGEDDNWDETYSPDYTQRPQVMIYPTRQKNEVLIYVTSDRPLESPSSNFASSPSQLYATGDADCMSLYCVNADIHTVMQRLSKLSGVIVVLDDRVQGNISAHLENVSFACAVSAIAAGNSLAFRRQDDAYYLSSAVAKSAGAYWMADSYSMPLRYVTAESVMQLLPDVTLSLLHPDNDRNAIAIAAPTPLQQKVVSDLQVLDRPSYRTRMKAWVIESAHNNERFHDLMATLAGGSSSINGDSTGSVSLAIRPDTASSIIANIRALSQQHNVTIRAIPMVRVGNGLRGRLFVGRNIYYWRLVGRGQQELTLSSIQAGALLDVLPRTNGEWITAQVRINNSFEGEVNALGPLLASNSLESTVRLRSGESMLIGGLHLASRERERHGFRLFRGRSDMNEEREVWIIVQATAEQSSAGTEDEEGTL